MSVLFEDAVLIADMDDTLLDTQKHFSQSNLDAIALFRSMGGRFTVATGRSIPSLFKYQDVFTVDMPMILCNGALIYDNSRDLILWERTLPAHTHQYVKQILHRFPDVCIEILTGRCMDVLSITPMVQDYLRGEQVPFREITPEEMPVSGWYKILVALNDQVLEPFMQFLATNPFPDVEIVFSHQYFCEILPKQVNKATGLERWKDLLGESAPKYLYAVGDYYNDVQMLKMADLGFAVANAPEAVRQQADVVVGHCTQTPMMDVVQYLISHSA